MNRKNWCHILMHLYCMLKLIEWTYMFHLNTRWCTVHVFLFNLFLIQNGQIANIKWIIYYYYTWQCCCVYFMISYNNHSLHLHKYCYYIFEQQTWWYCSLLGGIYRRNYLLWEQYYSDKKILILARFLLKLLMVLDSN